MAERDWRFAQHLPVDGAVSQASGIVLATLEPTAWARRMRE